MWGVLMSKLVVHGHLGRINEGVRFNEEITYRKSIDGVRFIDTFYIREQKGKQSKSFMGEM